MRAKLTREQKVNEHQLCSAGDIDNMPSVEPIHLDKHLQSQDGQLYTVELILRIHVSYPQS